MDRMLIGRRAALAAAGLFTGIAAFQVGLAAGAPWGEASYGGGNPGVLPVELRVSSAVAAAWWSGAALMAARRAGLAAPRVVPDRWLGRTLGALAGLSGVSVVLNVITPSAIERAIWAPTTIVTTAAVALAAAWGPGGRAVEPAPSLSPAGRAA